MSAAAATTMSGQHMPDDEVERIIRSPNAPVRLLRQVVQEIGDRDVAGDLARAKANWRSAVSSGAGAGAAKVMAVVEAALAVEQVEPVLAQAQQRLNLAQGRDQALAGRKGALLKAQKRALEVGVAIDETAEMLAKLVNEFECIETRLVRHREECARVGRLDLAVELPMEMLAGLVGAHAIELLDAQQYKPPAMADTADRSRALGRFRELLRGAS